MNFSLNVEKSLGTHALLQVGYVGTEARHLAIVRDVNQAAREVAARQAGLIGRGNQRQAGGLELF